jgi:potassium channel subfamily K
VVLLLGFAHRVRYPIAQAITITLWYISSLLLLLLIILTRRYLPLPPAEDDYSQSFYYGLVSAILYFIISTLLLLNTLGAYWFKAYPPTFTTLTVSQRTLMLQTIFYAVYLSIGAGIFSILESWTFVDALYWANLTLLTIGLGSDFAPATAVGRATLIPYAVGGIIMVGLIVGSVRSLFLDRGSAKFRRSAVQQERARVMQNPYDVSSRIGTDPRKAFELMRKIQMAADRRRKYWGLSISLFVYLVVWLGGAGVLMAAERDLQGWTYFESLYFTYVSLLTIGYGDLYPRSNAARPCYVIWSLLAIPTVTVLISNMGETVVGWVKNGVLWVGEVTILPNSNRNDNTSDCDSDSDGDDDGCSEEKATAKTREVEVAKEIALDQINPDEDAQTRNQRLARRLAREILVLSKNLVKRPAKTYEWEQWRWFLEAIGEKDRENGGDGETKWVWLGEDGPLLSGMSETEWLLEKMCDRLEMVLSENEESRCECI